MAFIEQSFGSLYALQGKYIHGQKTEDVTGDAHQPSDSQRLKRRRNETDSGGVKDVHIRWF